jgi:hypothetical protein
LGSDFTRRYPPSQSHNYPNQRLCTCAQLLCATLCACEKTDCSACVWPIITDQHMFNRQFTTCALVAYVPLLRTHILSVHYYNCTVVPPARRRRRYCLRIRALQPAAHKPSHATITPCVPLDRPSSFNVVGQYESLDTTGIQLFSSYHI